MNNYLNLTLENIDEEHICCAIGDKKHENGVFTKKEWLKNRIKEGHVFRKLNERGKVFIEYAPLEKAWVPISGDNYMYIYCLWVAGSFKSLGHGKDLLEYCINDSKTKKKNGVCILSSKKKKPYLSEKKFLLKYGFKVVDEVGDYELLSLSFNGDNPKFNECVKTEKIENKDLTIFYTPQCPYIVNCIKEITEYSKENNIKVVFKKIDTLEKSKNVPCVFNNWATFINGKYESNLLLNKNMVDKLINNK